MNESFSEAEEELRFFATAPRPCSYLPGRSAISVFADPSAQLSMPLYNQLADFGFRRSGDDLYVPACPSCSECVPIRVPVAEFERSRSQRRTWRLNRDLTWMVLEPRATDHLFPLYCDYLSRRHPDGGMDNATPEDYSRFLTSHWCDSFFLVGSLADKPVVAAVTDALDNGLSAVYTFFDTGLAKRSLGTLAILRQIELARDLRRDWLYLGYWIAGSAKMQYKGRFRPLQAYRQGRWRNL
jgi:arginyl-tRNA--protein-N-Asp/Glu arginylyltransferase